MGRAGRAKVFVPFVFLLALSLSLHATAFNPAYGGGGTSNAACSACENISEYNTSTMFLITDEGLQKVEIALSWGPQRHPVKNAPIIVTVKASSGTSASVNPAAAPPSVLFAPAEYSPESPSQSATNPDVYQVNQFWRNFPHFIWNPTTAPPTRMYVVYTNDNGLATFNFSSFNDSCHDYQFFYCYSPAGCGLANCFQALGLDPTEVHYASVDEIPLGPGEANRPSMADQDPQKVLSNIQTYTFCPPPPNYGQGTPPFCLPLVLIFSLLAGALFLGGRNPFSMFDFSTAKMGKHFRYTARGRGFGFDLYAIAKGLTSAGKITAGGAAGRASVREGEKKQVESMLAPYKKAVGAVKLVVGGAAARKPSLAQAKKDFGPGVMKEGGFWARTGQRLGGAFVTAGGLLNQRASQRLAPVFGFTLGEKTKDKVGFWAKVWAGFKAVSLNLIPALFRMTVFADLLNSLKEMVIAMRSYNSTAEALAAMANLRGKVMYNGQVLEYKVIIEKDRDGNPVLDKDGRPKMSMEFRDEKGKLVLTATMGANGMLVFRDAKGKIIEQKGNLALAGVIRDLNKDMLGTMNKVYLSLSFMAPLELADRKRELLSRMQDIMDDCKKKGEKAVASDTIGELKDAISKLEVVSRNELAPILAIIEKAEKSGNYVDACVELGRLSGVQKEALVSLLGVDTAKRILGSADAVVQYATFFTPEGFKLMARQQMDRVDSLTRIPPDITAAMGNAQAAVQSKDEKAIDAAFKALDALAVKYKDTSPALALGLSAAIADARKTGDFSSFSSFLLTGKPPDLQKTWEAVQNARQTASTALAAAEKSGEFKAASEAMAKYNDAVAAYSQTAAKYKDAIPALAAVGEEAGRRAAIAFSPTVFSGITISAPKDVVAAAGDVQAALQSKDQKAIDAAFKALEDVAAKYKTASPALSVALTAAAAEARKTGEFSAISSFTLPTETRRAIDVAAAEGVRTGDFRALDAIAAKNKDAMPELANAVAVFKAMDAAVKSGDFKALDAIVTKNRDAMPDLGRAVEALKAVGTAQRTGDFSVLNNAAGETGNMVTIRFSSHAFEGVTTSPEVMRKIEATAGEAVRTGDFRALDDLVKKNKDSVPELANAVAIFKAMDAAQKSGDFKALDALVAKNKDAMPNLANAMEQFKTYSIAQRTADFSALGAVSREPERYRDVMPSLTKAVDAYVATGDITVFNRLVPADLSAAIDAARRTGDTGALERMAEKYKDTVPSLGDAVAAARSSKNYDSLIPIALTAVVPPDVRDAINIAIETRDTKRLEDVMARLQNPSLSMAGALSIQSLQDGFKAISEARVQISILPTEIANAQAEAVRTGNYDRFFTTLAALEPASAGFKALVKAVGTEPAEAMVADAKKMTAVITLTQSMALGLGRMTATEIESRGLTELSAAVANNDRGAVIQWLTDPDNASKVPEILRASTSFSGQVTGSMESGSNSAAYLYAFRGELSTPDNTARLAVYGLSELPAVIGKGGDELKKYIENNGDKLKQALGEDGYRKLSESAAGAAVFVDESKRYTSQFSAYSDTDLKRIGLYEVKAAIASGDPFALRSALEKPGVFDALNSLAPKAGLQEAAVKANTGNVYLTEILLPTVKKDMPEFAAAIKQGPEAVIKFISDPANAEEVQKLAKREGKKPDELIAQIRGCADDIIKYPAIISQAAAELSKLPNEQVREFGLDRGVLAALNKGDPAAVKRLLDNPETAGKLVEAFREREFQRASDILILKPASQVLTRDDLIRNPTPGEMAYAMANNLDASFGTYNRIREHLRNDDYEGLARTLAGGQSRESMLAVSALASNSSSFHDIAKEAIQVRVAEHLAGGAMAHMRAIDRMQEGQKTADDLSKTYLEAVGPLVSTHPNKPSDEFIGILRDKDPERLAAFIADKRNEGDIERVAAAFGVGKENVRGELQQMADGWRAPVNINNTATLYGGTMMLAYNALPQQAFMIGLADTKIPAQTAALTESFFSGIYAAERQREQLRAQFDIAAASPTTNVAALVVSPASVGRAPDTIQRDHAMDIARFYEARAEALKPENREKDPQTAARLEAARPVVERAMDALAREKDPDRGAELLLYSRAIAQNAGDPARLAELSASLERYTKAKTPEAKSLETGRMLGLDSTFSAKDSVKHEALATYPPEILRDFAKQKLPGSGADIEKAKDEELARFVAARVPDRDVDAFIKRQGDPQVTVSGDKKVKYSEAAETCSQIGAGVVKAKTRAQVEEPRQVRDLGVHAREFKPKASTAYKPNDIDEWIMTPGTAGQRGMIYDPITKTMRPI